MLKLVGTVITAFGLPKCAGAQDQKRGVTLCKSGTYVVACLTGLPNSFQSLPLKVIEFHLLALAGAATDLKSESAGNSINFLLVSKV